MSLLALLLPGLVIMALTLVCALPWGTSGELALVLPMLPYALIHRCVERWDEATPDWLAFLAGFTMDVVGQGPLGYWALIYLCGYTMVRSATADRRHGNVSSIALFALTAVCVALMQWSVASIYYVRAVDVVPLVIAAGVAMLAYLVLLILLPTATTEPVRANSRLERGV